MLKSKLPQSLAPLASKAPGDLTDDEVNTLVAWFRQTRKQWTDETLAAASEGRRRRTASVKVTSAEADALLNSILK